MEQISGNVDFRLVQRFTRQVLCSCCWRRGRKVPVAQVISHRHRPLSLCPACRAELRREAAASG